MDIKGGVPGSLGGVIGGVKRELYYHKVRSLRRIAEALNPFKALWDDLRKSR